MTGRRYNGEASPELQAEAAVLRDEYEPDDLRGFDPAIGFLRSVVQYQGSAYIREVDGRWINGDGVELLKTTEGIYELRPPQPAWQLKTLVDCRPDLIPRRSWFMEDWLPHRQCTGLYGVPGVRKSLFVLQAMIAGAIERSFCGLPIAQTPVVGLFCEDDDDEIQRRTLNVLRAYDAGFADLDQFHYRSLVGTQAIEFLRITKGGSTVLGPPFVTFREQVLDLKPGLAILDTASDFFGGNENDRGEVAAFVRLLDGLAQQSGCALLFSAHPSRRGVAERSFDSGSTGWEGKVRARLVLYDPAQVSDDDDDDRRVRAPSDERVLLRAKSNYAAPGAEIPLVLREQVFWPKAIDPETAPQRGPMHDLAVEAKFLELMAKVKTSGRYVNDTPSQPQRYAPKVFGGSGFTEREFEKAMNRLLDKGRIRLIRTGSKKTGWHGEFETGSE